MDFEVNANGEITAYHGLGGDVSLPEDGKVLAYRWVFGDELKLGTLYLPKGFLGIKPFFINEHLFSLDPENYDAGIKRLGRWSPAYRESKVLDEDYAAGKVVTFLDPSVLPSVERFEVHPDNIAYASKDGLLYTKDFKILIACPAQYQGKVVLHDDTEYIEEEAFQGCSKVTDIVLGAAMTTFDDEYDPIFDEDRPEYVRIFGANIDWMCVWNTGKKIEKNSTLNKATLIFPNYPFASAHKFYKVRLAMGYCLSPESYSPDVAKVYTKYIKNNRSEILSVAYRINAYDVINYFNNLDNAEPNATAANAAATAGSAAANAGTGSAGGARGKGTKLKKLSPRNATLLLEEKVCYGTDEEVEAVLQSQSEFALTARALGLACRYGSMRKVELLSAIASFKYFNMTKQNHTYFGTYKPGYGRFKYWANYSLMSVIDYLRDDFIGTSKLLAVTQENELANAKILSEADRAEIIKFLAKHKILNDVEFNNLYYYALMFGSYEIAKRLQDAGASLKHYEPFIEGTDRSWMREDFVRFAFEEHPESALQFAKHAKAEGITLKISSAINLDAYLKEPKLFERLLDEVGLPTPTLTALTKRVIAQSDVKGLNVILATKRLKPAQVSRFITQAIEQDATELTSILMDYKNSITSTTSTAKRSKKRSSLSL